MQLSTKSKPDFQQLESESLDYKAKIPDRDSLARLFVAMANTKGGKIIVGIDQVNGQVVGIIPEQRIEEIVKRQL